MRANAPQAVKAHPRRGGEAAHDQICRFDPRARSDHAKSNYGEVAERWSVEASAGTQTKNKIERSGRQDALDPTGKHNWGDVVCVPVRKRSMR